MCEECGVNVILSQSKLVKKINHYDGMLVANEVKYYVHHVCKSKNL